MKPWKGRFNGQLHPEALGFSTSLRVDKRLYREDIEGSIAHAAMLAKQRIISKKDASSIRKGLREIAREIEQGKFVPGVRGPGHKRFVADDIHMAIENRLIQKIGPAGGRLHTGRSRNDQVALDERLYLRNSINLISHKLRRLQRVFVAKAEQYEQVVMPGYTHLQRAQPILLAHHLLAHVSMLDRDHERFVDCLRRVNRSPLGAGALAGTSFPIDRKSAAAALGFDDIVANSIDAVSDRDVQIEFVSTCAITMMHLSRFAEEMILWSSREYRFAEIGEAFTTGSSIMPQKKNPDIAELVRGKSGRVYGDLMALLTVMKGLPLAYNRDMQEDKEPLFDAADTVTDSLQVSSLMLRSVQFDAKRFEAELSTDFLAATELADYLVRKGLPFRKAHAVVGAIVKTCERRKIPFAGLSLREYKKFSRLFENDVMALLSPGNSISLKKSLGSTSPGEVKRAIRGWKRILRTSL
jgi:argininosuccinate lyase